RVSPGPGTEANAHPVSQPTKMPSTDATSPRSLRTPSPTTAHGQTTYLPIGARSALLARGGVVARNGPAPRRAPGAGCWAGGGGVGGGAGRGVEGERGDLQRGSFVLRGRR